MNALCKKCLSTIEALKDEEFHDLLTDLADSRGFEEEEGYFADEDLTDEAPLQGNRSSRLSQSSADLGMLNSMEQSLRASQLPRLHSSPTRSTQPTTSQTKEDHTPSQDLMN